MIKKLILGTLLGGAACTLLLGTSVASYVRTGVSTLRHNVKSHIPVDVELQRCRDMIQQISPEIAGNLQVVAREEVDLAKLQREIVAKESRLAASKSQILRLRDDLSREKPHYVYAGRTYSTSQVRDDLASRFEHFQVQEQNVDQLRKIILARESKLQSARQNLDQMLAAKRQLEIELENLEARMAMVQVAQTSSSLALDSSQLSRTRELMSEIGARIDVAEKLAHSESLPIGLIPLEEPQHTDILEAIATYFDESSVAKDVSREGTIDENTL